MTVWYLYIIRCRDNSLYTGIAVDVGRRFSEHVQGSGRCAKYLRGKGPLILAFCKKAGSRSQALALEYRVKRLSKPEKERIIEERKLPGFRRKAGKRSLRASRRGRC